MSFFYNQHPFSSTTPNRHPQFNFFNQPPPPPHHFGPRHPYHLYAQHPFFAAQQFFDDDEAAPAPTPAPAPALSRAAHSAPRHSSLDEEEAAALAHLQAIRKKKESERESIRREAAARIKAKQEREAAIQRAIAEKEREEAIARLVRQKEEEYARQLAIRRAIEERRNAEIQRRREAYVAAHEARQKYIQEVIAKKAECAKRYAARYAAQASRQAAEEVKKEYPSEFEQLNKVLGGLFGINLAPQEVKAEEKKEVKEEKRAEEVKEKKEVHFDQPKSTEKQEKSFPEDVNDLLSQFLGLRLEPTSEKPSGQTENKVPDGLNEFLSRFGLVFEPLDLEKEVSEPAEAAKEVATKVEKDNKSALVADPEVPSLPAPTAATAATTAVPTASTSSASTTKPVAKADDAPLTAFLNSFTDLPPFVRDILGNVELAFKEEINKSKDHKDDVVEGKGKGVATGEKNPPSTSTSTPAESTSSADSQRSLNKLNSISHELHLVKDSFEFPSILAFAPTNDSPSQEITPNLLFNKTNKTYHQQSNKLLQLLLEADSVDSDGDREVRKLRKSIVREVEEAIKNLEDSRDKIWKDVRDRREKGEEFELWEESDFEGGSTTTSSNNSVVDLSENHTAEPIEGEVEGFKVDNDEKEAGTVLFDAPEDEVETSIKVEDVAQKEVEGEVTEPEKKVEESVQPDVEGNKEAKVSDEKEEGYELL